MPQAPPPPPLLRPAIIELRYDSQKKFWAAARMYEGLLYKPEYGANTDTSMVRTFKIGYAEEAGSRDILLRLTHSLGHLPATGDHTVLYWKVARADVEKLKQLHDSLKTKLPQNQLTSVESPSAYETGGATPTVAAHSILQDATSGTLLGLTINPPVPTDTLPQDENGFTSIPWDRAKRRWGKLIFLGLSVFGVGGLAFGAGKRKGATEEREREIARQRQLREDSDTAGLVGG
ncbi:hypothetical protein [Hymenobacter daeguensis]